MKAITYGYALLFVSVLGTVAFGSGFKCEENTAEGYRVKMFNEVQPEIGTRTPAVLVISHSDKGTLLVRREDQIRKNNRRNTVQYVVDGSRKLDADTAILQVHFKEGRETLEAGETVPAELILVQDEDRTVIALDCSRYLKSE